MSDLKIIDKTAKTWLANTGAFRLPHPTRDHVFEPGVKYQMEEDAWTKGQPTIILTSMDEDISEQVLKPEEPKLPRVDRSKPQ